MTDLAFRATYSDWKLVKTRGVVQVIFEVPLADHDVAYQVVGGMPNSSNERWFAIAPLDLTKKHIDAKPKRDWRDVPPAEQAGIRCNEPSFIEFIRETRPDEWHENPYDVAECVRLICAVSSRSELGINQKARVIWHQLDSAYQAWLAKERVGA